MQQKKAVIVGCSHMHANEIAKYIAETPEFRGVGVCPLLEGETVPPYRYTPAWNANNVASLWNCEVTEDLSALLDREKPDIAFLLSENGQKAEVARALMERGIFTVIEKPMASTLEDALAIDAVSRQTGCSYLVNWPVAWRPYLHRMKAALDSGVIGRAVKLRYLNGHTGPLGKGARHRGVSAAAEEMSDGDRAKTWWHRAEKGGGALLDIGCYGAFFARWFFGSARGRAVCHGKNLNTPFGNTEDEYAALLELDGKMAVIEGTWLTPRAVIPSGPVLLGTEGVLCCTGGAENAPDVACFDLYGNPVELMPAPHTDPHLPAHLARGGTLFEGITPAFNLDVAKILEGMRKSERSGAWEEIPEGGLS